MRVLIDPGTSNCRNLGDVAVLQAAVARLRAFDRHVDLQVFTANPVELQRHCPGVFPADELGRREWIAAEFGLEREPPGPPGRPVDRIRALIRRARYGGRPGAHTAAGLAKQMDEADLYVVCGQATLTDADRRHALCLLRTASLAHARGIPVAFFSQGIGPLADPAILELARTVLGSAAVIGIREDRVAGPLLEHLGVPVHRVFRTGDDAVEAAYAARPAAPGNSLGVHLRIAPLAASSPAVIERLRPVLQESARTRGAAMIPLPISHHRDGGAYDPATIRALLAGYDDASDGGVKTDTPARVTRSAGRCRVVVTGAYHAAVFALAQGVPAICLGQSEYYLQKFRGLQDGFGPGCQVVRLDEPELPTRLREAIDGAWAEADSLRRPLLEAAEHQIASARAAYAALRRHLDGTSDASSARQQGQGGVQGRDVPGASLVAPARGGRP
jgi:colanic acid/amylovoran biosynthesis protein